MLLATAIKALSRGATKSGVQLQCHDTEDGGYGVGGRAEDKGRPCDHGYLAPRHVVQPLHLIGRFLVVFIYVRVPDGVTEFLRDSGRAVGLQGWCEVEGRAQGLRGARQRANVHLRMTVQQTTPTTARI